jgi:hypothetical protein
VDRVFGDRRGSGILLDGKLWLLFNRSAQKVENGVKAPQPEISPEWIFPSDVPGSDVERNIVGSPPLRLLYQLRPFVGWERVRIIVGDENGAGGLFTKGVRVVVRVIGHNIFFL